MSFYKTTFYVVSAALILMAVNSVAMTEVQHWVTHISASYYQSQTTTEKPNRAQLVQAPRMVQVGSSRQPGIQQKHNESQPIKQIPKRSTAPKISNERLNIVKSHVKTAVYSPSPSPQKTVPLTLSIRQQPYKTTTTSSKNGIEDNAAPAALPELVLYPDEIVIAFPKKVASTENIQKVVSRVLLSNAPLAETNLLKTQPIDLKQRPYFYRRVLDQNQLPVRYPMQAFKYADYLMEHHIEEHQDEAGKFITLHIPLVEYGITGPAKNYQAWVENYAKEYKIPPSLVYAVMETESAFNPNAVSRSNAIGLMQLKADAAGKDVYHYVDAKPGQPSLSELFDSKSNIRMGTAYLGLLKHDYLADIKDDRIKQMVTISSYNGGLSTVLELFGKTPKTATQQLNRMSPKQVYRKLRFEHQSDETRRYLEKVLKAETKYRDLLKAASAA